MPFALALGRVVLNGTSHQRDGEGRIGTLGKLDLVFLRFLRLAELVVDRAERGRVGLVLGQEQRAASPLSAAEQLLQVPIAVGHDPGVSGVLGPALALGPRLALGVGRQLVEPALAAPAGGRSRCCCCCCWR